MPASESMKISMQKESSGARLLRPAKSVKRVAAGSVVRKTCDDAECADGGQRVGDDII